MIIKILLIVSAIILVYGLLILIGSFGLNTDNADYIIVLGHKLNNNKISNVLEYRLNKVLEYSENNNCKIILSGGITSNNTISEAEVMKDYLVNNGINESRIILEDKSTDTVENIRNCKEYVDSKSKIVVISSNYHIVRAKMICRLLGLNAKGIGTYTPIIDLIIHLAIEEVFIFINYFRIIRKDV